MRHLCESGLRENRTSRLSGGRRPDLRGASSDPTAGLPAKARTTERVTRTAGSCGPRGRTSSWNWPWKPEAKGEARSAGDRGTEARMARADPERPAAGRGPLMESVVAPGNMKKALARVRRNKGAPGIDGMTVEELGAYLKDHWPETKARLLDGTYEPQPVRRVEIPKASGGVRRLGVPTVLDRFIQQAAMQVLQGDWDPGFSDASYGFRPGRSAHQAVERAQEYIRAGYAHVVDLDLECPRPVAAKQQSRPRIRATQCLPRTGRPRLPARPARSLKPSNRRVRTRMHGGVGGAEPRGSPLSRSRCGRCR